MLDDSLPPIGDLMSAEYKFVFLQGMRVRSGTNFISKLVSCHPEVRLIPPGETKGEFRLLSTLDPWLDAFRMTKQRCFGMNAEAMDFSKYASYLGQSWQNYLINTYAIEPGVVFLKDPGVWHLDQFFDLFPEAKLVLLLRDGRDNVASSMRAALAVRRSWTIRKRLKRKLAHATGYDLWSHGKEWAQAARHVRTFKESATAASRKDQILVIRYEEVNENPVTEGRRLLDFMGVEVTPEILARLEGVPVVGSSFYSSEGRENAAKPNWSPTTRSAEFKPVGRWHEWSWYKKRLFKHVAGQELEVLGYVEGRQW